MTGFKLRHQFYTAVLAGLSAMSALAGCGVTSSPLPDTQLVLDTVAVDTTLDHEELSAWPGRQESYLNYYWNRKRYQAWLSNLDDAKNLPLLDKANRVNDLVNNTVVYVSDSLEYGRNEYWAPGVQTICKGAGDCEDFAIAKLYALKYLDVPESRMSILIVAKDAASKISHAVLAVDTSAANNWIDCLILNNTSGVKNSLETLAQDGYAPHVMVNAGNIRSCKLKLPKSPAP